jgi:hypothetical protein
MKLLPRCLAVLVLLGAVIAQAQTVGAAPPNVSEAAARYLHACINAVAVAEVEQPARLARLRQIKGGLTSCTDPVFDLGRFKVGVSGAAVIRSEVKLQPSETISLDAFYVTVTDLQGRTEIGRVSDYRIGEDWEHLPPSPDRAMDEIRVEAVWAVTQKVLRACHAAIAAYRRSPGGRAGFDHDPVDRCDDPRLKPAVPGLEMVEGHQVLVLPAYPRDFRVEVTGLDGKRLTYPVPPPDPPPSAEALRRKAQAEMARHVNGLLIILLSAALLYLMTFRFRSSPALAGLGMVLSGGVLILFLIGLGSGGDGLSIIYLIFYFGIMLAGSLLFGVPRLVVWRGREVWWVSLGTGVLGTALSALLFYGVYWVANATGRSTLLPDWFFDWSVLGLPVLAMVFIGWGETRRSQLPPPPLP